MIEVTVHYPMERVNTELSGDRVEIAFILPKRPFLFWEDVQPYERIQYPKGFGLAYAVAYHDFEGNRCLLVPMPFNLLVGFVIWVYQWMRHGCAGWFYRHSPKRQV